MARTIRLLTIAIAAIALAALVAGIAYVGSSRTVVDLTGGWQLDREAPVAAGAEPLPDGVESRAADDYALVVGEGGGVEIPAGVLERLGLGYRPGRVESGSLVVTSSGRGVAIELVDQGELLRVPVEVEDRDHILVAGLRLLRGS
jgi:hypothetical protein